MHYFFYYDSVFLLTPKWFKSLKAHH